MISVAQGGLNSAATNCLNPNSASKMFVRPFPLVDHPPVIDNLSSEPIDPQSGHPTLAPDNVRAAAVEGDLLMPPPCRSTRARDTDADGRHLAA